MDSCIIPVLTSSSASNNPSTNNDTPYLIQTTDFFTPLVDDPYLTGRISACNVLSDLYACGVAQCDNVLMLLTVCNKLTGPERDIIMPLMMEGFNDACQEAGTLVRGGHTTVNPWPIIGGVATSVSRESEFVMPINAKIGQKLVLTKPLGTQIAVNIYQWWDLHHNFDNSEGNKFYKKLQKNFPEQNLPELCQKMYEDACFSMATLNQKAAEAMTKFGATSATDITGFGILGHAENLAKAQLAKHDQTFKIDKLPVLKYSDQISNLFGFFKLAEGFSAETSGGLLVTLDADQVDNFCDFLEQQTKIRPFVIGEVVEKINDQLAILDDCKIVEVVDLGQ